MMTARFTGKVVLVTGGGSGIGRTIAETFAGEGATVMVAGRTAETLKETVARIRGTGGQAAAVTADVTRAADVEDLVEQTVARFGGLDVAVNNAGVLGPRVPLAELEEADFSAVVDTNLTGVWRCLKQEIRHMRAHGGGAVVNVASCVGVGLTVPRMGAYAAAKAGVAVLTRTAAKEAIGDGIRVNAVSPGQVDTPMSLRPGETEAERAERLKAQAPAGRVGTRAEVAAAVLWLASPEASYVTGHELMVDGGATA
jgi:NAD(P)-dependent dehydrogenase (short-subunit alcohol dehydrogenase family)